MHLKWQFISIFILLTDSLYGQETKFRDLTEKTINQIRYKQFDSIYTNFDNQFKRQLSLVSIESAWEGMVEKYDTLDKYYTPSVSKKDSFWLSETKIEFVKKSFLLQISFNTDGKICGFFIRNINIPYAPPEYINTLSFYELKLNLAPKKISNNGTLTLPKSTKKPPLIIICGGSGPTDMNATFGPNKPYQDLAWALAAKGIAVYRYDKRTVNKANIKPSYTERFGLKDEYIDDLVFIVNYFIKNKLISKDEIYIMGHSQGGHLIPYFAGELGKKVKGYISLAGNFSTLPAMLEYQFKYFKSMNTDSINNASYDALISKAVYMKNNVFNKQAVKDSLLPGLTQYYLEDMETHRPEALISSISDTKLLFIQGGRDYQVPSSELLLWRNALNNACCVEFKTFNKLNHHMQEGDDVSTPAEYSIPNSIPEYLPQYISSWVFKQQNKK